MTALVHAGYLLPDLFEALSAGTGSNAEELRSSWRARCSANVTASFAGTGIKSSSDPILMAAANIVSRGLPTLSSIPFEERFRRAFPEGLAQVSVRAKDLLAVLGSRGVDTSVTTDPASANGKTPRLPSSADAVTALLGTEEGRVTLQLLLSPIAVAIVQRTLIEAVLAGALDLGAKEWMVTAVEGDVPCIAQAIAEFRQLLASLLQLEGKGRTVPVINAVVCPSREFHLSPLHAEPQVRLERDATSLPAGNLFVDIAMLTKIVPPLAEDANTHGAAHHVTLRPATAARSDQGAADRRFFRSSIPEFKTLFPPKAEGIDPETEVAVRTLLGDLFRITRPTEAQLQMIDHVLGQRSFIAALPPAAGKSLAVHFAALLRPALSFFVLPVASLAEDQRDQFTDVFIDAVVCLHEGLSMEERQSARERVRDGRVLALLATGELFRTEEAARVLDQLRSAKDLVSQIVIDEAQTLSEWSHDLRLAMQRAHAFVAARTDAGKDRRVPVRLLTSTSSRDVIEDLRSQVEDVCGGGSLPDAQIVAAHGTPRPQQHFFCENIGGETPDMTTARRRVLPELLGRQHAALEHTGAHEPATAEHKGSNQSATGSRSDEASPASCPTVVYCPLAAGPLGVTNRYAPDEQGDALDDILRRTVRGIGVFIGKDDSHTIVGRQAVVEANEYRRQFRRGEIELLVATGAYGIGTHKRDIHATVHVLAPSHVERLVQECGRGGHDGAPTRHTLLYAGTAHSGALGGDSPDLASMLGTIDAAAINPTREKQIAHDLLREISYPEDSNANRIANLLSDEFGIAVRVSYWQRGLEERMYLQQGGRTAGHIDLVTQEIAADTGYPDRKLAIQLLESALAFGLEAAGSGPSLSSWVAATFPSDVEDGLTRQLADFEPGASFTMRIGFENDREPLLTQIHQTLWRKAEIEIQRKLFSEIQAGTWADFRRQLEARAGRNNLFNSLDPEVDGYLQQVFNKIRRRSDTERFIFRLGVLGVVRDHESHPASRTFHLRVSVRSEAEIRAALERWLVRRMTPRQAARVLAPLQSYPGDTLLERALYFLIDHASQSQHERARAHARLMDAVCREGAAHGSEAFHTSISLALTAKYALRWQLPAALSRMSGRMQLLAQLLDLLESDRSASVRENAQHLAASCRRLEAAHADEPLLAAARAFAKLVNASKAEQERVRTKFVNAMAASASADGLQGESVRAALDEFQAHFDRFFNEEDTARLMAQLREKFKTLRAAPRPSRAVPAPPVPAPPVPAPPVPTPPIPTPPAPVAARPVPESAAPEPISPIPTPRPEGKRVPDPVQKVSKSGAVAPASHAAAKPPPDTKQPVPSAAAPTAAAPTAAAPTAAAPSAAAPSAAASSSAPPQAAVMAPHEHVDPQLLHHLEWLKTFNHHFLKHYGH